LNFTIKTKIQSKS